MRRAILLIYLLSGVNMEMRSFQHEVYVNRKVRSNSPPALSGYSYSKFNDGLGVISLFNNNGRNIKGHVGNSSVMEGSIKSIDKNETNLALQASEKHPKVLLGNLTTSDGASSNVSTTITGLEASPTTLDEIITRYDRHNDYRSDDDDLRKDSNMYDGWPYFHRSTYDYDHLKPNSEAEKAKDKRYIYDVIERVIPVQEDIKNDIPPTYYNPPYENYDRDIGNDNPMYGNQPFISSVLTDYFDANEEDPLMFKGLNWGTDFDNERTYPDVDESNKRVRRLQMEETALKPQRQRYVEVKQRYGDDVNLGITEKAYKKYNDKENEEIGDKLKDVHNNAYEYNGDNYKGFKNFVDAFVNKFGSEGHKKDKNYAINRTQDKGEKKKGFRRVYHKDEYQEDNEFYDNTNNKSTLTENGGSKFNVGGSEAILGSRAAAVAGNERSSQSKSGHNEAEKYHNRNKDQHKANGYDADFHRYKDIARMAAIQNNADYFDPF